MSLNLSTDADPSADSAIETVAQFTALLGEDLQEPTSVRWYRGIGSTSYKLVPSLYRQQSAVRTDADWRLDLEEWLLERFAERSGPFRDGQRQPEKQIELLFEMQHYGIPTRLLDWSENALVALWFAVEKDREDDAAVWVLDAAKWNDLVYFQQPDIKNILSPHSPEVENRQPWAINNRSFMVEAPTCIYGVHNTKRIVGQRGAFSLSGRSTEPFEEQCQRLATWGSISETKLLRRVIVPANRRGTVKKELTSLGFSYSMMFPDMPGLARELNERLSESGML